MWGGSTDPPLGDGQWTPFLMACKAPDLNLACLKVPAAAAWHTPRPPVQL
jgi:hypothetical protein